MKACQCGRPWCKAQGSKIKEYTHGPRLLLNCRNSYICKNKNCKNIGIFVINQQEFSYKGKNVVCSICGTHASHIRCDARLIFERNVEKKIITCKHYGTHTCGVELEGRVKKDELRSINQNFPKLTHEAIIRQKVQRTSEKVSYSDAVEASQMYTDTVFIDNIRKRVLSSRRPEGHCFKGVDVIRNNFVSEDEYLIFDYCDGSDGGITFVMKSSASKVELLLNLDKDGIHCLSTEAVFLDVLHSRYL